MADQHSSRENRNILIWFCSAAGIMATAFLLRMMGRKWWCSCGQLNPWASDINSAHNSQHLFDPYSFTHILHGIMFCGILAWIFNGFARNRRFFLAVLLESCWELLENSELIINRYRAATSSLGYVGDTIFNSIGDIFCCSIGFWIASYLGFKRSIIFVIAIEVFLLCWIRDSLGLNIVMLIHPFDAVKAWQLGR